MPSSQPTEPGSRSGGGPAGGGGDLAEEAVGGPGGEAAGGLTRDGGRELAAYLAFPRPEAWAKALIAPACFVLAATSAGGLGDWKRFAVLWLVLEFLIYAARYQWNDIRGVDADLRHAERAARSRLPVGTTAGARRRGVRLSGLTAAARVLAASLVGVLAGLTRQVLLLAVAVFVVAAAYEFLRALGPGAPRGARVAAVWVVVGFGYVIRGGLGLSTAGLAWGSLAMVAGLVCVGLFGIMFVLLTWALEATSYCAADAGGGWHARAELAAKPHLAALLPYLGRPVRASGGGEAGEEDGAEGNAEDGAAGPGRYCGTDRVLRQGRLSAPWNLALLAAAVSGAVEGVALARPHGHGAFLAAVVVSAAGAGLLAGCRSSPGRWIITAACVPVLVAAALLAGAALPVLAAAPWLAIAGLYSAFRDQSYRDLVAAGPRLAAALRKARGAASSG
jgi:hypothetical protein